MALRGGSFKVVVGRRNHKSVLILAAGLLAPLVSASAEGPFAIATINLRNAILQTREGSQRIQELEDRRAQAEEKLQKERAGIQALREKLAEGKEIMNAGAQTELAYEIERKTKQLQRDAEDAQSDLTQRQADLVNELRARILELLPKCAVQHNYSLIIDVSGPSSHTLYASKAIDVTAEVVRMYDQTHPLKNEGTKTISRNNIGKAASTANR